MGGPPGANFSASSVTYQNQKSQFSRVHGAYLVGPGHWQYSNEEWVQHQHGYHMMSHGGPYETDTLARHYQHPAMNGYKRKPQFFYPQQTSTLDDHNAACLVQRGRGSPTPDDSKCKKCNGEPEAGGANETCSRSRAYEIKPR